MPDKIKNQNFAGKVVLMLGDDISTDAIYPGRYMATILPEETPQFAFADYADFNSRLRSHKVPPGSVIVAGTNFGCGSSREQAASALKGYDLIIIARSFGRIFLQNAVNLGLQILVCPAIEASEGDEIEIDDDRIFNKTQKNGFALQPLPEARRAIMAAGGLIPYTRERLLAKKQ
jgi:3-isopropylmalate/(R)-2-methylmalate dehydratase small subunit